MCVKQSSSSPGLPAPCLRSKTLALTPSPGFKGEQKHNRIMKAHIRLSLCLSDTHTHKVKHSLWVSCGKPVAAEVGKGSTEWVPQASYRQKGHWPYPSPTHHPPCSSRFPSNHTESCREYREPADHLYRHCLYSVCVSERKYLQTYIYICARNVV